MDARHSKQTSVTSKDISCWEEQEVSHRVSHGHASIDHSHWGPSSLSRSAGQNTTRMNWRRSACIVAFAIRRPLPAHWKPWPRSLLHLANFTHEGSWESEQMIPQDSWGDDAQRRAVGCHKFVFLYIHEERRESPACRESDAIL